VVVTVRVSIVLTVAVFTVVGHRLDLVRLVLCGLCVRGSGSRVRLRTDSVVVVRGRA
jgi:hypothetical protein